MFKKAICMLGLLVIVTVFSGCFKEKKVEESFVKKDTISIEKNFKSTDIKTLSNFEGGEFIVDKVIKEDDIVCNSNLLKIVTIGDTSTKIALASINGKINSGDNLFSIKNYQGKLEVISIDKPIQDMILKRVDGEKLLGDFNNNGKVDLDDFMEFAKNYGQTYNSKYDIAPATTGTGIWVEIQCKATPDSVVNINDFIIFAKNYGKAIPSFGLDNATFTRINEIENNGINYLNNNFVTTFNSDLKIGVNKLYEWFIQQPEVTTAEITEDGIDVLYKCGYLNSINFNGTNENMQDIPGYNITSMTNTSEKNLSITKRDSPIVVDETNLISSLKNNTILIVAESEHEKYINDFDDIINNSKATMLTTKLGNSQNKLFTVQNILNVKPELYGIVIFMTHGSNNGNLKTDEVVTTENLKFYIQNNLMTATTIGKDLKTIKQENKLTTEKLIRYNLKNGKIILDENTKTIFSGKDPIHYILKSSFFSSLGTFSNSIVIIGACHGYKLNSVFNANNSFLGAPRYILTRDISPIIGNYLENLLCGLESSRSSYKLINKLYTAEFAIDGKDISLKINSPIVKASYVSNKIKLEMQQPVEYIKKVDGYKIYRTNISIANENLKYSICDANLIGETLTNEYLDGNNLEERTYYYRIIPYVNVNVKDSEGKITSEKKYGEISNEISIVYKSLIAPTGFQFIGNYKGMQRLLSGKLSWDATSGATGYYIYKTLNSDSLNWSSQDWLTKIDEVEKIEITGVTQLAENSIKFGKKQYYTIAAFKNNEKGEKVLGNLSNPLIVSIRPDIRDIVGFGGAGVYFYEVEGAKSYKFYRCMGQEMGVLKELTPMNVYGKLWYNFGSGYLEDRTNENNFLLRYKIIAYDDNGNSVEGNIGATRGIVNP